MCACGCVCLCMCVCERKREGEREKKKDNAANQKGLQSTFFVWQWTSEYANGAQ